MNARNLACALYLLGATAFTIGINMGTPPGPRPISPLDRALARGQAGSAGIPKLGAEDPMANAAILEQVLSEVPEPGHSSVEGRECVSKARSLALSIEGRQVFVRFSARIVCQLDLLKQISIAQPGFGPRGVGEVGAFVLGRRSSGSGSGASVDVSRLVIPPFRFTRDTLHFVPADLGPLEEGERFVGTYHTHPEGDIEQGVLSEVDLRFMRYGRADFHGEVGSLRKTSRGLDWLFDVVDPREGQWNVYAHDARRLEELLQRCEGSSTCPLDDLRMAGSRSYLLARVYDGRLADFQ